MENRITKGDEKGEIACARDELASGATMAFRDNMKTMAKESFFSKLRENNAQLNFSSIWQGSIASLMSCDNITDDLVKEAMQELETALEESQKLLNDRDLEIIELRRVLEESKQSLHMDLNKQEELLDELEKSQKRILELESELRATKHKEQTNATKAQAAILQTIHVGGAEFPECTCYCGSVCNALREVGELKKKLELIETKYANLKKKIRERRKAEAEMNQHRHVHKLTVADRSPSCCIQ